VPRDQADSVEWCADAAMWGSAEHCWAQPFWKKKKKKNYICPAQRADEMGTNTGVQTKAEFAKALHNKSMDAAMPSWAARVNER
jgi:hypothetical protein